jgi:uncharacterized protein (DUF362 family)
MTMDDSNSKSDKTISRRDFMAVVGGVLVATELGAACGSDASELGESIDPNAAAAGPAAPAASLPSTGAAGAPAITPPASAAASAPASTPGASATPAGAAAPSGAMAANTAAAPATTATTTAPTSAAPATTPGTSPATTPPSTPATSPATMSAADSGKAKVIIITATDRKDGIMQALTMFGGLGFAAGRDVIIKPNFNSTYEFPATTHDDTIRTVVEQLKAANAGNIILGESSGATTFTSAPTQTVTSAKNTLQFVKDIGIDFVSFDEPNVEWETFMFDGMTWSGGLAIPKLMRSDRVKILLPCCKTHTLADYTFSMKLAAGLPPRSRRGLVSDMHTSLQEKVVDINKGFKPDLILMDALKCFIDGGPDEGTEREPGLIVAATDRVALDAVGVAILKSAGSTSAPIAGKIFETAQMKRAVAVKLGIASPAEIELVGNDPATLSMLRGILDQG